MKKLFSIFIVLGILMFSTTCFASAFNEVYFNGNKNYISFDGGMGRIWYVVANTINVQRYNPPEYIIAIDIVQVNPENNTMGRQRTERFLYNYDLQEMYIESYNPENKTYYWEYLKDPEKAVKVHVSSMPISMGEIAFALAYNMSFYKDEDYPVFAKSGSIIPMAVLDSDHLNDSRPPRKLEIQVFPGRSNAYRLYEDDGVSNLYEEGYYIITNIDYNYRENNYTLIIRPIDGKSGLIPDKRDYKIRFRNTKYAEDVKVNVGRHEVEFEKYIDDADFIIEVKDVPTIQQLTINCAGKDIEIDAVRLINEEIDSIISDLNIETKLKEKIANIIFSDMPIRKKRIEIRKLRKDGLKSLFVKMFIKLLEYIAEI